MSNIYDTANQLERDLREAQEFLAVKESFEAMVNDEVAKALYDEFRAMNVGLQQKQMSGQEVTEEMQKAQELYQTAIANEKIQTLMQAEQRLNVVIQDINNIITKSLQELYQG